MNEYFRLIDLAQNPQNCFNTRAIKLANPALVLNFPSSFEGLNINFHTLDVTTDCRYNMEVNIEWDPQKNKTNQEKHGLSFEDAALVFRGRTVTFIDDRYEYGELRYVTFGELMGRVVVIAHTYRDDRIRIISMRKANEREQKKYQE